MTHLLDGCIFVWLTSILQLDVRVGPAHPSQVRVHWEALVEEELLGRFLGSADKCFLVVLQIAPVCLLEVLIIVLVFLVLKESSSWVSSTCVWVGSVAEVVEELSAVLLHLSDLFVGVHVTVATEVLFRVCLQLVSLSAS